MVWQKGQRLYDGKYIVEKKLGDGGFGITYLATTKTGDRVVIKTLNETVQKRPDFQAHQSDFLNESLRIARCQHRHIVNVHELFQEQVPHPTQPRTALSLCCMVLEYIDGQNLAEYVTQQGGVLSESEALGYIQQIGEALMVVHEQGLLHRDVKPLNIMLRSNNREAVLIDFGIARDFVPDVTMAHTPFVTPGFAPVEQHNPRLRRGAYTDIYALAATLYYIVTGAVPPNSQTRQLELLQVHQDVLKAPQELNLTLSDDLNRAIMKGMAVMPQYRPQTMVDWFHLLGLNTNRTPTIVTLPPTSPTPSPTRPTVPMSPPPASPTPVAASSPSPTPVVRPPSPSPRPKPKPAAAPRPQPVNRTRRHLLRWLGLGCTGVALAAVARECWPAESVEQPVVAEPISPLTVTAVKVNDRGEREPEYSVQVQVYDEGLGDGVSLRMVEIPGGSYERGQTEAERQELIRQVGQGNYDNGYADELPRRSVTVPRFFMGMFQVTQAQYAAIMGENPSRFSGNDRPVEQVSWNDAKTFCDRLSDRSGRRYALPSEAEWEYACRAGTTTPFHFGPTLSDRIANYRATSTYGSGRAGTDREETTDVGSFPANDFGLYDMHGNVWEWCADHYRESYEGVPTDGSPFLTNNNSALCVLRGGSWGATPRNCRSANRNRFGSDFRFGNIGFRVVVASAWTPG
jgi:formylglycine-generating enzyme required for sulfatase activity/serine/threonine protein kinase